MSNSTQQAKKKHEAISASRTLLEGMISGMREGVIAVDSDLRILASNPTARMLLGQRELNFALDDAVTDETIKDVFERALVRGDRSETKVELRVWNDTRVYDLRVAPLTFVEKREQKLAIGIFYDITRLERLEKVRQEFLSNVSHELRTPLTSILAFVETLEDGALDDPENSMRFLGVIRRNAERMHHLIDDILELSAIEAGKVLVEPKDIRLAPLVEEAWAPVAERARSRNLSFHNEVARDTQIFADPRRLEQILVNLMSNAVKFNHPGGSVTVSYEYTNGLQLLRVIDNGEGMSAEHLPRIFERFYRTDTARSRELGGTGLGLAIVKHLARLHGGEVKVTSSPGEGSVFTVQLPDLLRN
jgi:two-component system phosphate regulon sensor histidine kinase PhoR